MKTWVLVDGHMVSAAEAREAVRELDAWRERQRRHDEIVWLLNQQRPVRALSSDYVTTVWAKECYL